MKPFCFDEKVAVETILYLAKHSQDPTFHHIAKLLYFADRSHLKNYGRFICGDSYVAMKHGPVPGGVYDMMKEVRSGLPYLKFSENLVKSFEVRSGYIIVPLREPDLEWLSDSDIECLNAALTQYDSYSFGELTTLSHDDAWNSADANDFISIESLVKSIGDPEGLWEHLNDSHP